MEAYEEQMNEFVERIKNGLITQEYREHVYYSLIDAEIMDDDGLNINLYLFYFEQSIYLRIRTIEEFRQFCEQWGLHERIVIVENNLDLLDV